MAWLEIPPTIWVETESEALEMARYLRTKKELAFDTETTGLNTMTDYPVLFSFSDGIRRYAGWAEFLFLPEVRWLLESGEIIIIGTNLKFDMHMCANRGIFINGPIWDTLSMDFLFDENRQGRHGLKDAARDHCGIQMQDFKVIFPMMKKQKGRPDDTAGDAILRAMADPERKKKAINYSGLDAYATFKLKEFLQIELSQISCFDEDEDNTTIYTMWDYFVNIESKFTKVLWLMERRGFTICKGYFQSIEIPMKKIIKETQMKLNAELSEKFGEPINLNSPAHLRRLFYEILGKTPTKWTTGGASGNKQPSTDKEVLTAWAEEGDPYAKAILEYSKLTTVYDTFVVGLQEYIDTNFKLHTSLNQHVTVTGRLSSSGPNCQNIPRPATDRFKIRDGFIASPGKRLIVFDYSQLEMLILAHKSNDPIMIEAIKGGKDLHCLAVSLIFAHPYEEVIQAKKDEKHGKQLTDKQKQLLLLRQAMKNVGYGIVYGIGAKKLAHDLTLEFQKTDKDRFVDEDEAQGYIDAWYNLFRGVKEFIAYEKAQVKKHARTRTFLRRLRRLPEINSGRFKDRIKAERQAINIIQGDAADILRIAMIVLEYHKRLKELNCVMILQVHDELIFEIEDDDSKVEEAMSIIKYEMEESFNNHIFKLRVPLSVEGGSGYSWKACK